MSDYEKIGHREVDNNKPAWLPLQQGKPMLFVMSGCDDLYAAAYTSPELLISSMKGLNKEYDGVAVLERLSLAGLIVPREEDGHRVLIGLDMRMTEAGVVICCVDRTLEMDPKDMEVHVEGFNKGEGGMVN